ncbi:MAG: ribosome maturation factor RimM [Prevotellaceae bacterium]|jgi:16S rRNA processing protein RimM|nr:ribosome maturation factor RimM [Prevotellaceae bacterium]
MISAEEVLHIGQFNKPHGIHGELSLTFTDEVIELDAEACLICLLDGILVPFFVESYRPRSGTTALVKLWQVDSTEQARGFTNIDVFVLQSELEEVETAEGQTQEEEQDPTAWHDLEGYTLIESTTHTPIGLVTAVDSSTANTLFVVDRDGQELLLPAHETFIRSIDDEAQCIYLHHLPEGLLNPDEALDENDDE